MQKHKFINVPGKYSNFVDFLGFAFIASEKIGFCIGTLVGNVTGAIAGSIVGLFVGLILDKG